MSGIQRVCSTLVLVLFLPLSSIADQKSTLEFEQAEKTYEAGNFIESEKWYRQAMPKYQHMGLLAAYIENQIAFCLRYQGKVEEAVAAYKKVRNEYPESPLVGEAQENIARTYYEAGDYAKAAPEFERLAQELEVEEKEAAEVKAAGVGGGEKGIEKDWVEKKNEAYGYAELSFFKAGKLLKARSLKKRRINDKK